MREIVNHKLTTLTILRTLKHHIRHPVRTLQMERRDWFQYFAGRRFGRLGLKKYFTQQYLPSGGMGPDWADLWNIYCLVRERRPEVVVELGSGCSSTIFAAALAQNKADYGIDGHLYTFDADEHWFRQKRDLFPEALRAYATFIFGREEAREMNGESVRVCTNLGDAPDPDLLYVDGLNAVPDIEIGAEAILAEETAPQGMLILVDGRGPTVEFLKKHLKRRYLVRTHPVVRWTTFTPE